MDMNNYIGSIAERAADTIKFEEGDYYNADGLLMCGKCNTPKQSKISILGHEMTPLCLCKCMTEKRNKKLEQDKKEAYIKHLFEVGIPCENMREWTFENDDGENAKLTAVMKNYVENFEDLSKRGKGLILYGTVGTGKTYAACQVANELIKKGVPVLVTNFAELSNPTEFRDLGYYKLLVIDDLNSERDTSFMQERVYDVINSRYIAKLPMIITTNLTINEIKKPSDLYRQRIYNRILEMCIPIEVAGGNKRNKNIRNEYQEYKTVLGLE